MIARVWRGAAASGANSEAYVAHFRAGVLPELEQIPGFLSAQLLRRTAGSNDEFVVTTYWQSLDAIRAFAGADLEAAVVGDEAKRVLARFEERAVHYEVIVSGRKFATAESGESQAGIHGSSAVGP